MEEVYAIDLEKIPDDILVKANKVFSKHTRYEIKQWSATLMKHYNMLISNEKPLNLDYARPFSNTNDLARNVPELSPSTAVNKEKREKERQEFIKQSDGLKEIYVEKETGQKISQGMKIFILSF